MLLAVIFLMLAVLFIGVDMDVAYNCFKTGTPSGRALGWTVSLAAFVSLCYICSVVLYDYFAVSVFSALYFTGIDCMLVCLLYYVVQYIRLKQNKLIRHLPRLLMIAVVFDICAELLNPFFGSSVTFVLRDSFISHYVYDIHPLYLFHLGVTYTLVGLVLLLLIYKVLTIPGVYRDRYLRQVYAIIIIVVINCIFLYLPKDMDLTRLDFSIFMYSVAAISFYWNGFSYTDTKLLENLRSLILNNISQGIVVFDYDDELVFLNETCRDLLPDSALEKEISVETFAERCSFSRDFNTDKHCIFQHYYDAEKNLKPISCDYTRLEDHRSRRLGRLFLFTDTAATFDRLTGFKVISEETAGTIFETSTSDVAAVCDINALAEINSRYGRHTGDRIIVTLSNIMRRSFPETAELYRGREAYLVVLCRGLTESVVLNLFERVKQELCAQETVVENLGIQYAVAEITGRTGEAVEAAILAMKEKKLMDSGSAHSHLLSSLVRTLEESDQDTEQHVRRTQKAGEKLGRRLGLSDLEQSELSLLCIMHDIGKVAIPSEILNKAEKLTPEEWELMKTHTFKGYQIAKSSKELNSIAEFILHHHERWDGKGYPDGLSKESIPLLSRIIAVVDSYDTMVSGRPYKAPMSEAEAIKELQCCAGAQFDPNVAAEFIAMIAEEHPVELIDNAASNASESRETDMMRPVSMQDEAVRYNPATEINRINFSRYIVDSDLKVISANEYFEYYTGYTQEDVKNGIVTQKKLIPPQDWEKYFQLVKACIADTGPALFEHNIVRKEGRIYPVICLGRSYIDQQTKQQYSEIIISYSGTSRYVRNMVSDLSSKANAKVEMWEKKYRRDPLTALLNREAFTSEVAQQILINDTRIAFIMLDLNNFKGFNDANGHLAGDNFLIYTADTITACMRKGDAAGRIGGDEFAVMLVFPKNAEDRDLYEGAHSFFRRLNARLTQDNSSYGVSGGCTISGKAYKTFSTLYEEADHALYAAKAKTEDRFAVADHSTEEISAV